ncbi:hypothetical protein Poli38472_003345 [Pythium oligandrum]|uniref:SANT and BTB domain-containing protein n=1 Tax=Pythium oligandrum TaxID=41045 RepID=A0A8K1FBL8_PYTOL|nr:hypothetical protein Poli38472_003345 [Pythium oligandrum]|eukprot:TMW57420.1 hypothetical protein Poli38472_003345 [Pythium oligandrum]
MARNVLIHVFDEYRKATKDFVCPREVLLDKMKYFRAYLNQANEHDEIDISVHCDVEIFEWLVEYMNQRDVDTRPKITLENIASILVSSEFLQMDVLVEECVAFVTSRMQEFLQLRVDFGCLSDTTITKLAERCTTEQLQRLQDPKDKILSKLQRKKLELLLRELQEAKCTLCCCENCELLYLSSEESQLHCSQGVRQLSAHGELVASHRPKTGWVPDEWLKTVIQDKNVSWGAAYWYVWASTQYMQCDTCQRYCSLLEFRDCFYHPGQIVGVGAEAKYSCCGARIFLGGETDGSGCKSREHKLAPSTPATIQKSVQILNASWSAITSCSKVVRPPPYGRSCLYIDMSIVCPAPTVEQSAELDQVLKKPWPMNADAASPRRRRQWQTMRLQEQDRIRIQVLTKRLLQLRQNLTV